MRVRLLESCSSALDGGQTAPSARISRDRAASKITFALQGTHSGQVLREWHERFVQCIEAPTGT